MSETLLNWLNNDIKLSHQIKNFAKDFSNGFLFAEVLKSANVIESTLPFINNDEPSSIYDNYTKLRLSFEKINIHLTEDKMNQLINKHPREAAKLLYQLKTQLDRKTINFDVIFSSQSFKNEHNKLDHSNHFDNSLHSQTQNPIKNTKKWYLTKPKLKPLNTLYSSFKPNKIINNNFDSISMLNEIKEEFEGINKNKKTHSRLITQDTRETNIDLPYLQTITTQETNYDNTDYCCIDKLDANLISMGTDLKTLEPNYKKYTVDIKNNYIMTSTLMKRLNHQQEEEKLRKQQEALSKKIVSETQQALQNSVIKIPKLKARDRHIIKTNADKQKDYEEYRKLKLKINQHKRIIIPLQSLTIQNKSMYTRPYEQEKMFNNTKFFLTLDSEERDQRIKIMKHKKEERDLLHPKIKDVLNVIIELTEEIFNYQHDNNCDYIELPGWKEWMTLFIEGKTCIKSQTKKKAYLLTEEEQQLYNKTEAIIIPDEFITSEIMNYISMIGQWSYYDIIPKKELGKELKIYDILGDDLINLLSAGKYILQGVMPSALKTMTNESLEPKREELENVILPSNIITNDYLGNIIEYSIELKSNESTIGGQTTKPIINTSYAHIPLKLCFYGHYLSGRKTLAKCINDIYPDIKVYSIDNIIKDGLDLNDKLTLPIENLPKFKTLKKNQIEQIEKDRADEYERNKYLLDLVMPLHKKEIESISDENMIDLLLLVINKDFPSEDYKEIKQVVSTRVQRKKQIIEELNKMKEEQLLLGKKAKPKVKEEKDLKTELDKLTTASYKGFIMVDFPKTYEQFLLLEKKTNGYIQEIEKEQSVNEQLLNELAISLDKQYHKHLSKSPMTSFFDNYICLEVNEEETIKRYTGQKIDPNTKIIYHPEYNPPPEQDKKLKERLIPITEPSPLILIQMIQDHDHTYNHILDFLSIFNNIKFISTKTLQGKEEQLSSIKEMIEKIIKAYEEGDSKSLIINTTIEEEQEEDYTTKYIKRINDIRKKFPIQIIEGIFNDWSEFNCKYSSSIQSIFKGIETQKERIISQMNLIQREFIEYLQMPSNKNDLINIFINKYNRFVGRNYLLKFHPIAQEEFNKDLSELTDYIWEMIDIKKKEAINERQMIMTNGFIEKQFTEFYTNIENIFLLEAEKFIRSTIILRQFYTGFDIGKSYDFSSFKPEKLLKDLTKGIEKLDILTTTQVFKNKIIKVSPRIDKLYCNSLKMLFKYDCIIKDIETTTKISSMLSTSEVSVIKTFRKKKTFTKNDTSHQTFENIYNPDEELRNSLKAEKNKFKARITLLKFYGINYLNEITRISQSTFKILDEWIVNSVTVKNDTMNQLRDQFHNDISGPLKEISQDIEFDKLDIYTPQAYSFFPKLINQEQSRDLTEYDSDVFKKIVFECKDYCIQGHKYIDEQLLIDIFFKKYTLMLQSSGIPEYIKKLNYHHYQTFISYFHIDNNRNEDKKTTKRRIININHFLTIIALSKYTIITKEQEDTMMKAIESKLINHCNLSKEDFIQTQFWFEIENEKSKAEDHIFLDQNNNNEVKEEDKIIMIEQQNPPFKSEVSNVDLKHKTQCELKSKGSKQLLKLQSIINDVDEIIKEKSHFADEECQIEKEKEPIIILSEFQVLKHLLFFINANSCNEINYVDLLNVISLRSIDLKDKQLVYYKELF